MSEVVLKEHVVSRYKRLDRKLAEESGPARRRQPAGMCLSKSDAPIHPAIRPTFKNRGEFSE